jgi:hypothetical protein
MTDFSKIGKSNRNRGASYERKIAHALTDGLGVKFKRSPRSGALLREGKINGVYIGGDLTCEKNFKFSIECKNCKDANIEAVVKNPTTASLVKYWCQCVYDSIAASDGNKVKFPLLFFNMKSVRMDYACLSHHGVTYLKRWHTDPPTHIYIPSIKGPVKIDIDNKQVEMTDIPPMYIILACDFIDDVKTESVFYPE